ncbi:ATP-binding protein (plasmid) [Lichenicola cladoniae]|uniref:ATP-binding protein n=1 Tax=Lichenicola cladoniae TaxID=1484109 RepID=A0A6M8I0G1_9PROT|nr:ATP-binding protein [Lichenicola cladoniae]NPD69657.1 ATP-binding protein [Acetobacteraceae bacterium]QKE93968.1 ATP-binding protein [Lichenicola cladoniae]
MTIKGLEEEKFRQILAAHLTPSQPISSPEHLKGREHMLTQISRSFNSPGKHIFIHGDRGVGKTSLAQTAATLRQSSDAEPILVGCSNPSFLAIVRDAVKRCLPVGDGVLQRKRETKLKAGIAGFGVELTRSIAAGNVPDVESVNDAVQLLKFVAEYHSTQPVIILDEFDQLTDDGERKLCAQMIKEVSDQRVNVKFIICGIGSSLVDLIGSHLSTGRYLAPYSLDRLTHDARWDILTSAATAMGVEIGHSFRVRIGQISDGFPSYIHLIGEQILWNMFDDETETSACAQTHFNEGVRQAVSEAQPTLKAIYEKATQKYSNDYEEILWALADQHLMRRQTTDIYDKSYLRIMGERSSSDHPILSKPIFSQRLNSLKSARHGEIIVGTGAGWYEFRENIVRGFVRLKAESMGIEIGVEGYG